MPKTHLPAHMDSVRQKCRPKHQLLILKCYPRLPKNSTAEAKPNGSELSYLVYYASTRRSKLQKVGSFIERKTASDVSRSQSARVMVTLMILTALLENKMVGAGSGFALIAPYILRVIREILNNTNDISLIEASAETWDVLCEHQDQALLAADHQYRDLYEQVVKRYAAFAHRDGVKKIGSYTQAVAVQDQIRLRQTGLEAIKSVLVSDALGSESGRQLSTSVPAILSNMRGNDGHYLERLVRQGKRNEDEEKERQVNRRQSMTATRTLTMTSDDTDPRQAEGTASDADEIAEEELAVLALSCLRSVFASENRGQVRTATLAVLKFFADFQSRPPTTSGSKEAPRDLTESSWATKLFEMCTAWIPVQDRFILMLTAVEILVRLPLNEPSMPQHLLYTNLIGHVLRSDLNLIGLSVMDIQLGLLQQILRILQLSGPGDFEGDVPSSNGNGKPRPATALSEKPPQNTLPSAARLRLVERLKDCVADLATHVYYTDQIADMIAAILLRLKPNPIPAALQNPVVTAAAIEEPRTAVHEVASNVSVAARDRSNSMSNFFSFETARYIALEAVRDIMKVANSAKSLSSGGVAESRNKVPISIWEGTQWLLRDPAAPVRRAYVDALTTWLGLETKRADFWVKEPAPKPVKSSDAMARRAISNASNKNRGGQSKKATSTFLQLLHLAIYESVMEYAATSEADILLLHLLLTTLARKLGANAIQGGLPMVFALQAEVPNLESAVAKVRTASLVHGYFWTLTEVFNFDTTSLGSQIVNEITRRKQNNHWLNFVTVPAAPLESIAKLAKTANSADTATVNTADDLQAFDDRKGLVDRISEFYTTSLISPPTSPPGSPGRSPARPFNTPKHERTPSSYLGVKPILPSLALPERVKDAMMETWSRETCLAAIAAAAPRSISLSGSRTSPKQALLAGNHQGILAAAAATAATATAHTPQPLNPAFTASNAANNHPLPVPTAAHRQQAFANHLTSHSPARKGSAGGSTHPPGSSSTGVGAGSGAKGTLRVDDLKRILAGGGAGNAGLTNGSGFFSAGAYGKAGPLMTDTESDSMVDFDDEDAERFSAMGGEVGGSELGFRKTREGVPATSAAAGAGAGGARENEGAVGQGLLSLRSDAVTDGYLSLENNNNGPLTDAQAGTPLASNGSLPPSTQQQQQNQAQQRKVSIPPASRDGKLSVRSSRSRFAMKDSAAAGSVASRADLRALLEGVGIDDGDEKEGGIGVGVAGVRRPPY